MSLAALLPAITPGKGGGFDLRAYLSSLSNGFLFDYTDPDWLRQEPTGPTAVAATNDVIGFNPSRRLAGQGGTLSAYLEGQPELVVNGGFGADLSSWSQASTGASNWTWDNGVARANTNGVDNARLRQAVPVVAGRSYFVTYGGTLAEGALSVGTTTGGADLLAFGGRNRIFTATANTAHLNFVTNGNGATLDNVTVKEVSRAAATQATSSRCARWQGAAGARFDALDDNHLTSVTTPVGPYFMAAVVTVPASLSGLQIIAGQRATLNERFFMGIEHTTGRAAGGVGSLSTGTIFGGPDLRGRRVPIGIAVNGSVIRLYADGVIAYEGAQSGGGFAATTPLRIGALNDIGVAQFFFGGDVGRICGGTDFPDLARFNQLAATLGA